MKTEISCRLKLRAVLCKIEPVLSLGLFLVWHYDPVICFPRTILSSWKFVVNINFFLNLGLLHSGPKNCSCRSDWHSGDRRGRCIHQHRRSQWLHLGKQLKIYLFMFWFSLSDCIVLNKLKWFCTVGIRCTNL